MNRELLGGLRLIRLDRCLHNCAKCRFSPVRLQQEIVDAA